MDILIDPYRSRAPLKLTSRPYPVRTMEQMGVGMALLAANLVLIEIQSGRVAMDLLSGNLQKILLTYNSAQSEHVGAAMTLLSGGMNQQFVSYDDALPDNAGVAMLVTAGSLTVTLVTYSTAAPESGVAAMNLISGSLA